MVGKLAFASLSVRSSLFLFFLFSITSYYFLFLICTYFFFVFFFAIVNISNRKFSCAILNLLQTLIFFFAEFVSLVYLACVMRRKRRQAVPTVWTESCDYIIWFILFFVLKFFIFIFLFDITFWTNRLWCFILQAKLPLTYANGAAARSKDAPIAARASVFLYLLPAVVLFFAWIVLFLPSTNDILLLQIDIAGTTLSGFGLVYVSAAVWQVCEPFS